MKSGPITDHSGFDGSLIQNLDLWFLKRDLNRNTPDVSNLFYSPGGKCNLQVEV